MSLPFWYVKLQNATFDQEQTIPVHLSPGSVTELNVRNTRWIFYSGETVTVTMEGYQPKAFVIP